MCHFEERILSDILVVKILDILNDLNLLPKNESDQQDLSWHFPAPALAILQRAGVIDDDYTYTEEFLRLYVKRGQYIISRVKFIIDSTLDILEHGENLFRNPEEFMKRAKAFSMFDYTKGFGNDENSRADTERWCTYVSALTDIEAPPLIAAISEMIDERADLKILEFGGNIGVFGEHFCKKISVVEYQICDIPTVSLIGAESLREHDAPPKITYSGGDMFSLLKGDSRNFTSDIYIFKSVLHDWPVDRVESIFRDLAQKMNVGAKIIILERFSISSDTIKKTSQASDVANFVFAPFYRAPEFYTNILDGIDYDFSYDVRDLWIDMKWFVLVTDKS